VLIDVGSQGGFAELLPAPETRSGRQVRAQLGKMLRAGSWVMLVL